MISVFSSRLLIFLYIFTARPSVGVHAPHLDLMHLPVEVSFLPFAASGRTRLPVFCPVLTQIASIFVNPDCADNYLSHAILISDRTRLLPCRRAALSQSAYAQRQLPELDDSSSVFPSSREVFSLYLAGSRRIGDAAIPKFFLRQALSGAGASAPPFGILFTNRPKFRFVRFYSSFSSPDGSLCGDALARTCPLRGLVFPLFSLRAMIVSFFFGNSLLPS